MAKNKVSLLLGYNQTSTQEKTTIGTAQKRMWEAAAVKAVAYLMPNKDYLSPFFRALDKKVHLIAWTRQTIAVSGSQDDVYFNVKEMFISGKRASDRIQL